ncbi:MAG TPA: hypothetical protein VLO30_07745, partial [Chthoniobacterales bacterium]|nr:hypothetical protein [Chthoniobacterales bacterium]
MSMNDTGAVSSRLNRLGLPAIALLLTTTFAEAGAQPQTLALEMKVGKLAGPGAEAIRGDLAKAQFVLFGEEHGFADSPIILRAIAREARPLGFKYHAVEVGPLSTRMIRETLARNGLSGLRKLVHEVPLGIPFLSLKDDAELAGDFQGADSKGTPFLWGIDQEFIGSPPFHLKRLVEIAPNDTARAAAGKLLAEEKEASEKAAQEKFLLTRFHNSDFDALAAQFNGQEEAQNIIAELKESAAIYQLWMSGHNYENNARRARLLAKNFLAAYKSAAEPQPKVLFKMGVEHVALGTTTVNTIDLGTLATSIARTNGQTALRIAFLPVGGHNVAVAPKPGNPATVRVYESKEAKEFFASIGVDEPSLPKEHWTVIPLEPIRQSLDTKGIDARKQFS